MAASAADGDGDGRIKDSSAAVAKTQAAAQETPEFGGAASRRGDLAFGSGGPSDEDSEGPCADRPRWSAKQVDLSRRAGLHHGKFYVMCISILSYFCEGHV